MLVQISGIDLMSSSRLISTGILGDKKNMTFTPKDAIADVNPGPQIVDSATPVTEIDLTQFLTDPSAAAPVVAEISEKIGHLTASDVGLTWWCPTGQFI
jgi:hypothetical protein